LGRIVAEYSKTVVSISRLDKIFDQADEYTEDGNLEDGIKGKIEFKDVSFKFNDTEENLLENVSFKINDGETIALIGKTGAGKSTLVKLLVRLLDHQDGEILIDGCDITTYKKRYLRDNIGVILQEPFLFSKSVEENIGITLNEFNEKRVRKAAQLASIDDDIANFENGYNTLVGEKGVTLSGGQKQRVAIARLLINQKPIMIFDDSLSALDTETDLAIRKALQNESSDTTVIIITHRITTAMEADRIMVLEKGQIVQNAPHAELVKTEGLYKNLYEIQTGLEQEYKSQGGGK
jgi:ATP-binding cassette subfamily B protein